MAQVHKMPKAYAQLLYCVEALEKAHQGGTLTQDVLQLYAEGIKGHAKEMARSAEKVRESAKRFAAALEAE